MAEILRYVDPNSTAGGDGTAQVLTGATRAYVSLNAWEAATQQDLTDGGDTARVVCSSNLDAGGGSADTTAVTIDGWATGAHITIEAASSHGGKFNSAIYRLSVSDEYTSALYIGEDYVRLIGLQVAQTGANGHHSIYIVAGAAVSSVISINKCIISDSGSRTGDYGTGIRIGSSTVNIINTLIYGCPAAGIRAHYESAWPTVNVDNSDICANGTYGIDRVGSDSRTVVNVRNCYLGGNTTDAYNEAGGTITRTTCAHSSATSYSGSTASVAYSTANFTNVTAGSEDFHLVSGSALIDQGTDLSGTFTDDIDGVTRTGTWDIGADEYVAAGAGGEPVGLSDAIYYVLTAGGTAYTRNLAESLGVTDYQAFVNIIVRAAAESVGVTDSAVRAVSLMRVAAETVGTSDAQAFVNILTRTVAETTGVTDAQSVSIGISRALAEVVGLTDSQIRAVALWRDVSESIGVTYAVVRVVDKILALSETIGLTDAQVRLLEAVRSVAETVAITDAYVSGIAIARSIYESLGITDSVYVQVIYNAWVRAVAESVGVSDYVVRAVLLVREVADQCGVTDQTAIQNAIVRVLPEILDIGDGVYRQSAAFRYIQDSVGPADALTSGMAYLRALADDIGVSDAVSTYTMLVVLRTVVEAIGVTDAQSWSAGRGRSVADTIDTTDAQERIYSGFRTIADSLGITDFDSKYKEMVRSLPESVGVLDDAQKTLAYIRNISDSLDVGDALLRGLTKLRAIAESIGVSDADTWRIITAAYLSIALGIYEQFVLLSAKSKRITMESKSHRITLEVE